ncbi:flagellar motor protein MotB, partial [candidate division KSB1 bacterium]
RATSVVRILVNDYNLSPIQVTASGKGEYYPKADNETPEGRAVNRRTEIIIAPNLDEVFQLLNK